MLSIEPLKQVGYDPTFFKLPLQEGEAPQFTYYTFSDSRWGTQPGYWDLIGLHLQSEGPWRIDMRLLHIEEEALEWTKFEALRDADDYLSLDSPRLQALIYFCEHEVGHSSLESKQEKSHFLLMNDEESVNHHINQLAFEYGKGNYYRYLPDENVQSSEKVSIILFPDWLSNSKQKKHYSSSLFFATFNRNKLDDPKFYSFLGEWCGFMTFDQIAWQEFVALLRQRAM